MVRGLSITAHLLRVAPFFYVNQFQSSATSNYNALQTTLTLRNWHGLNSTLNYTWSHSLDTASDGQDFVANATQPDNSFNRKAEYAPSNFDIRHAFKWFFQFETPKTQHQWSSGYGFDGVLSLTSGQPFSVTWQFEDDYNGTGEFFGRPDLVGDPYAGTRAPDQFLNLSAFQAPCTPGTTETCVPPDPGAEGGFARLLADAVLHAPGFTLRGGTNEVLRGIVARGLGLR